MSYLPRPGCPEVACLIDGGHIALWFPALHGWPVQTLLQILTLQHDVDSFHKCMQLYKRNESKTASKSSLFCSCAINNLRVNVTGYNMLPHSRWEEKWTDSLSRRLSRVKGRWGVDWRIGCMGTHWLSAARAECMSLLCPRQITGVHSEQGGSVHWAITKFEKAMWRVWRALFRYIYVFINALDIWFYPMHFFCGAFTHSFF